MHYPCIKDNPARAEYPVWFGDRIWKDRKSGKFLHLMNIIPDSSRAAEITLVVLKAFPFSGQFRFDRYQ